MHNSLHHDLLHPVQHSHYTSAGGVRVQRAVFAVAQPDAIGRLRERLDA